MALVTAYTRHTDLHGATMCYFHGQLGILNVIAMSVSSLHGHCQVLDVHDLEAGVLHCSLVWTVGILLWKNVGTAELSSQCVQLPRDTADQCICNQEKPS